jgi:hypothetical protein
MPWARRWQVGDVPAFETCSDKNVKDENIRVTPVDDCGISKILCNPRMRQQYASNSMNSVFSEAILRVVSSGRGTSVCDQ